MFKKIRFTTEYLFYYLKKNLLFIFLGLAFGSAAFLERNYLIVIYQRLQTRQQSYGIEGLYHSDNLSSSISKLISFGLTEISDNDRIINSPLVQNLDIRNNNLEYQFTINTNYIWQNGKKLVSSDIVYPYSGIEFSYPDPSHLVIKLNNSFSPILSLFAQPLFLKNSLIGLGDYRVTSSILQEGYLKYLYLQNIKTGTKLVYKFYPSEKDLINAFKLGEVDNISLSSIPSDFKSWAGITITQQIDTSKYSAIFLNTEKISQKPLRQALAYATPKTNEKNQRCLSPISPNSWAYTPGVKEYSYNPTRSKELFDIKSLGSIRLLVADRKLINQAEIIKQAWEKILGIQVEVLSSTNQSVNLTDYDAILAYGSIPVDPDQFSFWHSTQSQQNNITHLNNPRIDKLLEEGRNTFDIIERNRIYQDFQRYLLEESPAIFLEFPVTYTINRVK